MVKIYCFQLTGILLKRSVRSNTLLTSVFFQHSSRDGSDTGWQHGSKQGSDVGSLLKSDGPPVDKSSALPLTSDWQGLFASNGGHSRKLVVDEASNECVWTGANVKLSVPWSRDVGSSVLPGATKQSNAAPVEDSVFPLWVTLGAVSKCPGWNRCSPSPCKLADW